MNSVAINILQSVASPILSKVRRYKNAHKGESCYIIGGGISLKWFDLGSFSDKLSIPCQYVPMHRDFGRLSAPYAFITEPFFFYPYMLSWHNTIQPLYRELMKKHHDINFFVHLSNYPVVWNKNVTFLLGGIEPCNANPMNRFSTGDGSLNQVIKMAIYMGFDSLYLVGFDYTHSPSRNLHWIEKGKGEYIDIADYNQPFFEKAKNLIDITTITLDGVANNIKSVTYEQHTGRKPKFKENTEILDDRSLRSFATWPGYKIF
jgi:hypothetical protein